MDVYCALLTVLHTYTTVPTFWSTELLRNTSLHRQPSSVIGTGTVLHSGDPRLERDTQPSSPLPVGSPVCCCASSGRFFDVCRREFEPCSSGRSFDVCRREDASWRPYRPMDGRRRGVPGPLHLVVGSGGLREIIAAAENPAILGLAASAGGAGTSYTSAAARGPSSSCSSGSGSYDVIYTSPDQSDVLRPLLRRRPP